MMKRATNSDCGREKDVHGEGGKKKKVPPFSHRGRTSASDCYFSVPVVYRYAEPSYLQKEREKEKRGRLIHQQFFRVDHKKNASVPLPTIRNEALRQEGKVARISEAILLREKGVRTAALDFRGKRHVRKKRRKSDALRQSARGGNEGRLPLIEIAG